MTCKDKEMIASEILKTLDIAKTSARIKVLETLIASNSPLSILDLKRILPEFNESTLYRNLDKFIQLNIVKKINLNSDFSHYEFQPLSKSNHGHHHHHIVCTKCKAIQCLDICGVEAIILPKIKKLGFTDINHTLEFSGICKKCSK